MAEDNGFAMGYALGQDSGGGRNSGLGGLGDMNGILGLAALGLIFGDGFGNFGSGRNNGGVVTNSTIPVATQADVRAAVDQQTLISKLDQQTYGLADSTYALNNTITNGFHSVDNAICNLGYNVQNGFNTIGHQISDCCCTTQNAIHEVGFGIERATMQNRFDAQTYNCNTLQAIDKLGDRIINYMSNEKAQNLRDENFALKLAASQANQNAYITANQQAQTAELIRRLGADCPSPAYLVQPPTPVNFPVNGCGQVQFGNNGCGCGC